MCGELQYVVGGAVGGTVDLFTSRMVWSVRVLRKPTGLDLSSRMYGEEQLDREKSIHRALEIAQGLAAGQRP